MSAYRQFTTVQLLDKLIEAVEERDTALAMRQDSRAGIAVGNDEQARRWQRCDVRVRKLHQELRGRIEHAEAWATAYSDHLDELQDTQELGV